MTIDKVDLTKLVAVRSMMTPGAWDTETSHAVVTSPEFDIASCDDPRDAAGIAATHNAADVLIEVARTSIDLVASRDLLVIATLPIPGRRQTQEDYRAAVAKVRKMEDAHRAAAAKVWASPDPGGFVMGDQISSSTVGPDASTLVDSVGDRSGHRSDQEEIDKLTKERDEWRDRARMAERERIALRALINTLGR